VVALIPSQRHLDVNQTSHYFSILHIFQQCCNLSLFRAAARLAEMFVLFCGAVEPRHKTKRTSLLIVLIRQRKMLPGSIAPQNKTNISASALDARLLTTGQGGTALQNKTNVFASVLDARLLTIWQGGTALQNEHLCATPQALRDHRTCILHYLIYVLADVKLPQCSWSEYVNSCHLAIV
jgi:hypothetical protein